MKKTKEERIASHREASTRYALNNPEKRLASKEKWRKNNLAKYAAYAKKWAENNREKRVLSMRLWGKKHSARLNALKAKRMADKKHATPAWANLFFIEEIYDLARRRTAATGTKHSVDHIVPLVSDIVCGLHVENNLRVIPHLQNISKRNRWWPDMP